MFPHIAWQSRQIPNKASGILTPSILSTTLFTDTFTDTDTVLLTNHISDSGHTWTEPAGTGNGTVRTNRIYAAGGTVVATAEVVLPSPNYYVEGVFDLISDAADNIGIIARVTAGDTYYLLRYSQATDVWGLFSVVAGSATQIGIDFTDNWTTGSRTVRLDLQGTNLRGYINGTERFSGSDNTITSAGKGGFRLNTTQTTTTLHHITSLTIIG